MEITIFPTYLIFMTITQRLVKEILFFDQLARLAMGRQLQKRTVMLRHLVQEAVEMDSSFCYPILMP